MKILICQNVEGQSEEAIKAERESIENKIKEVYSDEEEAVIIWHDQIPSQKGALFSLGKNLERMNDADALYFADGYTKCRNGMVEYLAARLYNKKIIRQ